MDTQTRYLWPAAFSAIFVAYLCMLGDAYSQETDRIRRGQRLQRQALEITSDHNSSSRSVSDEELLKRRTANKIVSLSVENALNDLVANEQIKNGIRRTKEAISDFGTAFQDSSAARPNKTERVSFGLDISKRAAPTVRVGEKVSAAYDWSRERVIVAYTVNF